MSQRTSMFLIVVYNILPPPLPPKFKTIFPYIQTKVYIFTHLSFKKPIIFSFFFSLVCSFVSIFLNLGFTCFNRKLTEEKEKKPTFHVKEKLPKCCWFCLIDSACSSSSLSSTQKKTRIVCLVLLYFVFLGFIL